MVFMKVYLCILAVFVFSLINSSCAPVQFSKSETIKVGVTETKESVQCDPKIAPSATSYTYTTDSALALPNLLSNCKTSDLTYEWVVKKSDMSVVTLSVPTLTGANPQSVDLRILGAGTYYVFLNAKDNTGKLSSYTAATPLEFVVSSSTIGNSLTCDPKLNDTLTSVTLNANDANAKVSANCNLSNTTYIWTVTKNGTGITIAGLSGAMSTPDIKSYGLGTYKISLYATAPDSAHWQSSTPLTVIVNELPTTDLPAIVCNPRINGNVTNLTLNSASSKPLISANCVPSDGTYTWQVKKSGETVTVADLKDANSNPDFMSLGTGTYMIYLTVSKSGYKNWATTTPLQITVDNSGGTVAAVNCSPRLNGDSVAVTIQQQTTNPTLTSNCVPVTATHEWTVYKNGVPVVISNISGASSTPDFLSAGLGTYYIFLTAKYNGYNSYVLPAPLEVTITAKTEEYRKVTYSKTVQASDNKVDILLVVDDSNSMLSDNRKLADKLQTFVSSLTSLSIDWNMCVTITRAQDVSGNGTLYWGASRNWVNYLGSPKWVMKAGASDPNSIFKNTIEAIGAGWAGTDDERGIKAAYWHAEYGSYNNCYRDDASLSVIMISDEDERSVGGDPAYQYYTGELQPLDADDLPANYVNKIKQKFGMNKRFAVNSIIVKPNDSTCMSMQDADGSKSHYGFKYAELSGLTNGSVGSICDSDYSQNLNYFKERIVNTLGSIPLECTPVGDVDVKLTPSMSSVSVKVENNSLIFNPAVPIGYKIDLNYNCSAN